MSKVIYKVSGNGRDKGALGASENFSIILTAKGEMNLTEKLYNLKEHIMFRKDEILDSGYLVLTENSCYHFDKHSKAFDFCDNLKGVTLSKGVYKIISENNLGRVNIYGGYESSHMMETTWNKDFNFKVI